MDCHQPELSEEYGKNDEVPASGDKTADTRVAANVRSFGNKLELKYRDQDPPDSYCPALSPFDWWSKYGQCSVGNSKTAIENTLAQFFAGLVISCDTYEAQMTHEEKAHRHRIVVHEAGILIKADLENRLQFPQAERIHELLPGTEFEEISNHPQAGETRSLDPDQMNRTVAYLILLNRKTWYASDRVSSRSTYTVDIAWCISEFMKGVFGFLLQSQKCTEWLRMLAFMLDDCRVLDASSRRKAFEGFLDLAAALLSLIDEPLGTEYDMDRRAPIEEIQRLRSNSKVTCCLTGQFVHKHFGSITRSLMQLFDPLIVEASRDEFLGIATHGLHPNTFKSIIHTRASAAFKCVTVLRFSQMFPLFVEDYFDILEPCCGGCDGFKISMNMAEMIGSEELAWISVWGMVYSSIPLCAGTVHGLSNALEVPEYIEAVSSGLASRWSYLEALLDASEQKHRDLFL